MGCAPLAVNCSEPVSSTVFVSDTTQTDSAARSNAEQDKLLPRLVSPRLVILKKKRKLRVFDGEILIKTYRISLGFSPDGDKVEEGDGKTPEGDFYIYTKNPKSQFYLSLGISYPGIEDAERGLRDRLIGQEEYDQILDAIRQKKMPPQKTRLGGEIYIHGGGTDNDWTQGCAAVNDQDMKELFDAVPIGTQIRILS